MSEQMTIRLPRSVVVGTNTTANISIISAHTKQFWNITVTNYLKDLLDYLD